MALDPKYICTSDLESVFLDKLTGFPLAGGRVEFYINGTNTPKNVFQLTQSPPDTFVSLGPVVTLDSIGQYSDGANSVVVYYYPYKTDGSLELYEARVYSSDNILQFTRYDWPPLASNLAPAPNKDAGVENYIPNGQFLAHNTNGHFVTDTTTESGITIYEIAQGGWSFKHSTAGTSTYTITFNSENNFSSALEDAPPYSVSISNSVFDSSDAIRDLTIQWPGVNTFSRKLTGLETNPFNLFFAAKLNSGTSAVCSVYFIRNYGSGGSTTDISAPVNFTINSSAAWEYFNIPFLMPDNSGKNLGAGNFFAIAIRMPADTINARFTDFAFTLGADILTQFPIMTNDEQLSRGVAGWMPTPDPSGMDLYLPLVLTTQGMTFDQSIVGQIIGKTQSTALPNELMMDGQTTYVASAYSSVGIPYQRLMNYLLENSPSGVIGSAQYDAHVIPMYGTGANFATLYNSTAFLTTKFYIGINTTSALGAIADGAVPTGWTFTIGLDGGGHVWSALVSNISVPTGGMYWTFTDGQAGLVYNVYYTINGVGAAPATPTGANIKVDLTGTPTVATTITTTINTVNQYQFGLIDTRGYFWRGLGGVDPDVNTREVKGIVLNGSFSTGPDLGSVQGEDVQPMHWDLNQGAAVGGGAGGTVVYGAGTAAGPTPVVPDTGSGVETRPVNYALNWFIKY